MLRFHPRSWHTGSNHSVATKKAWRACTARPMGCLALATLLENAETADQLYNRGVIVAIPGNGRQIDSVDMHRERKGA